MLVGVWALLFGVDPFADEVVNDRGVTRFFAAAFGSGQLPYRDISFEYPPLAAPVLALSGVFGTGEEAFRQSIGLVMFPFAAAAVLLTGLLAGRSGGNRLVAMLGAALAPLAVGAVVRTHFDLVAVALTLAALALLLVRRHRPALAALAFAVLGLGALVKGFPIVVAPVALAWLVGRGEKQAALAGSAALATVLLAGVAAATALSVDGARAALRFQLERPAQVESSPAVALYGLHRLGLGQIEPVANHRSNGIEHPADAVVSIAFLVVLLAVVALLTFAASLRPGAPPDEDARLLCLASLAAVTAFVACGSVLSPQFIAWTIPLLALALAWRLYALAAPLALAAVLTLAEFPGRYMDLVSLDPLTIMIVAVRDASLLAAVAIAVAYALRLAGVGARRGPRPATGRPPAAAGERP